MQNTHVTVDGGEQWLSWAYSRARAMRSLGLPYMTKRYEMGDGSSVVVRLAQEMTYIELKQVKGGYGVVVLSDTYDPPEYSILSDIRDRLANPPVAPYKRTNNKYRTVNASYWVGGTDRKKPKVSHVNADTATYVTDGGPVTQWNFSGGGTLVKVVWIAESNMWVYVTVAADAKGYNVYGVSPISGTLGLITTLPVGTNGVIPADDFGIVDVSPDGKKIMFVWTEADPALNFRVKRLVREHQIISAPAGLPIFSTAWTDTDVTDKTVSDTRDDAGFGTVITEKNSFFGYSWGGVFRYATERSTDAFMRPSNYDPEGEGTNVPINPETGRPVPGTYTNEGSSVTTKRDLVVAGATIRSATGSASHSGTVTVADAVIFEDPVNGNVYVSWTPASTYTANSSGTNAELLFFDPRSGAYAVVENRASSDTVGVTTAADYNSPHIGSYNIATTIGPQRVVLRFDGQEKGWEIEPVRTWNQSLPISQSTTIGPGAFPPYPLTGATLAGGDASFASRRPGEGVFAFNPVTPSAKKLFAVIGHEGGIADFISEDTSGLETYGKPGLKVVQVYPI